MWKNEQALVKYVQDRMSGCEMTRIESHGTGNGIPDMYVTHRGFSYWIEFKNMPRCSIFDRSWKVAWRPGQQAWMLRNTRMYANGYCSVYRYNFTVIGMKDGLVIIPMYKYHTGDVVFSDEWGIVPVTKESLKAGYDLSRALDLRSFGVRASIESMQRTAYECVRLLMNEVTERLHEYWSNRPLRPVIDSDVREVLEQSKIDEPQESLLVVMNGTDGIDRVHFMYDMILEQSCRIYGVSL